VPGIVASLASCLDSFLGALLHDWALVDPASGPVATQPGAAVCEADEALGRVLAAQLVLETPDTPPRQGLRPLMKTTTTSNRTAPVRQG
jgi:flagellar biosynthesis protein FlhG